MQGGSRRKRSASPHLSACPIWGDKLLTSPETILSAGQAMQHEFPTEYQPSDESLSSHHHNFDIKAST